MQADLVEEDQLQLDRAYKLQHMKSPKWSVILWVSFAVIGGVVWGLITSGAGSSLRIARGILQRIFVVAWTVKFYPQLTLSIARHSTLGQSIDTSYLALFGYISFMVASAAEFNMWDLDHDIDLGFSVFKVLLSAHDTVCSAIIICQLYYYQGIRRVTHKGRNSVSPRANFFISIFTTFNAIYLIILFIPGINIAVSQAKYLSAFQYCAGFFLSARWIPLIWQNYWGKMYIGTSTSSIMLEMIGSCSLLAYVIINGYLQQAFASGSGMDIFWDLVEVIAGKLLLSVIASSSILSCTLILCQSNFYGVHSSSQRSRNPRPPAPEPPSAPPAAAAARASASHVGDDYYCPPDEEGGSRRQTQQVPTPSPSAPVISQQNPSYAVPASLPSTENLQSAFVYVRPTGPPPDSAPMAEVVDVQPVHAPAPARAPAPAPAHSHSQPQGAPRTAASASPPVDPKNQPSFVSKYGL